MPSGLQFLLKMQLTVLGDSHVCYLLLFPLLLLIFSSFFLVNLTTVCLRVFLLGLILYGTGYAG